MAEKSGEKAEVKKEARGERGEGKKLEKKLKGKKWFTILAPDAFDNMEIGRTVADEAENIVGRKINVSLMELMGNFKKYYLKMSFRIVGVKDDKASTEFAGSECLADFISRMVHRYSRRVDTVQDLSTKDGKGIRVKTITIMPKHVKSSVQTVVRNRIKEIIKKEVEASTLDEFLEKMLNDDIKAKVISDARRIYPIRNFEVRKTETIKV